MLERRLAELDESIELRVDTACEALQRRAHRYRVTGTDTRASCTDIDIDAAREAPQRSAQRHAHTRCCSKLTFTTRFTAAVQTEQTLPAAHACAQTHVLHEAAPGWSLGGAAKAKTSAAVQTEPERCSAAVQAAATGAAAAGTQTSFVEEEEEEERVEETAGATQTPFRQETSPGVEEQQQQQLRRQRRSAAVQRQRQQQQQQQQQQQAQAGALLRQKDDELSQQQDAALQQQDAALQQCAALSESPQMRVEDECTAGAAGLAGVAGVAPPDTPHDTLLQQKDALLQQQAVALQQSAAPCVAPLGTPHDLTAINLLKFQVETLARQLNNMLTKE